MTVGVGLCVLAIFSVCSVCSVPSAVAATASDLECPPLVPSAPPPATAELFEPLLPRPAFEHVALQLPARLAALSVGPPACASLHYNVAACLQGQGRFHDALPHFERATELDAGLFDAWYRVGTLRQALGRDDAVAAFTAALALRPADIPTLTRLGLVLLDTSQSTHGVRALATAVRIGGRLPERAISFFVLTEGLQMSSLFAHAAAVAAIGASEFPHVYELQCRLAVVRAKACDWRWRGADARRLSVALTGARRVNCLVSWDALYLPLSMPDTLAVARIQSNDMVGGDGDRDTLPAAPFSSSWVRPWSSLQPAVRRLRVGFASSHLSHFACGRDLLFIFASHRAAGKIDVLCFGLDTPRGADAQAWRARIAAECHSMTELGSVSDDDAAVAINRAQPHVLVNVNGWIQGHRNRIFALRPAPVQPSFKDYPGSSGAPQYQSHILVDAVAAPPEFAQYYPEGLAYLPGTFHLNSHLRQHPDLADHVPSLQALRAEVAGFGVPNSGVLLACFNSLYKIDPVTFDAWATALRTTPHARLWLFSWNADAQRNLLARAARLGVGGERVLFTPTLPEALHKRLKGAADVFVDTPAYNAHGTMTDALFVGTPALTLPGEKLSARIGASLVLASGGAGPATSSLVSALVARNADDYAALLQRWARSQRHRLRLRQELLVARGRGEGPGGAVPSATFDLDGGVRSLEAAFAMMWQLYCDDGGQRNPPHRTHQFSHIVVSATGRR